MKNKEATSLCAIYSFDGSFSDRPRVIFEEEEEPNLPKEVTFNDCLEEGLFSYMARREEFGTIIAGYPWFSDWGRDTLITLRGFIKDKQMRPQVYYIIKTFAKYQYEGTLPNMICGNNDSNRDTSDAPLYLILAIKELCEEYNNHYILTEQITEDKNLREVLEDIVGYYILGTPNGIVADRETLLVYSPSHFTWIDTNHPAGSPREGYPIEIQCLWYSALEFLGYHYEAEKVSQSIEKYFFSEDRPFASDCLHCGPNTPAKDAIPDDHLRCNQLFCITMNAVKNPSLREKILTSSQELLIPGAIRTLANRKVDYPLPITLNGQLLNNPNYPYQGYYAGPEDTSRKIAYHNGTAWVWPFPSYCEALFLEGGKAKLEECISLLHSVTPYLISGVIGHLPEVIDGNFPHKAGGCAAQAWSLSEVYRVNKLLSSSL